MSEPLIVLTGAAGPLGLAVHRTLREAGKKVRATDRRRGGPAEQKIVKANLDRPADCRRVLQDAKVLVHMAYCRGLDEYRNGYTHLTFDKNIRMNRQVFLAACEAGVKRIVFTSSIQVVAPQLPRVSANQPPRFLPLGEHSHPEPDNWYSLYKLCSEEMLAMLRREFGIDYVILRLPILVPAAPVPDPERYRGRLGEAFSYLTFRDAADLILKVIDSNLTGGRTYLPASRNNTQNLTVQELLRTYYTEVKLQAPIGQMGSLIDFSNLTHDTGWEPQDLSEPETASHEYSPRRNGILNWWRTSLFH